MNSNFCSRPFTDMHIEENGNVTPCCVMPSNRFYFGNGVKDYFYGDRLKKLQNQFKNNERPKECEYCWDAEAANLKTHRKQLSHHALHQIHVRLNNVCNFKCRICNPKFSSTWAMENKKHKLHDDYSTEKDVFDYDPNLLPFITKLIKYGDLKMLNISGGEPLLTDANFRLLNHLIEHKATSASLLYSTNLSSLTYNKVSFLDLWKRFYNVQLEVSCDGWGDAVEYSRTGFNRETFFKNLVKSRSYVSAINCVVSIYSVWTLPQLYKLAQRLGIRIIYSPCFLPDHLNPQRLLREDKEELRKIYSPYPELTNMFNSYIDVDLPTRAVSMIYYNTKLDEYRGSDFFKVFPQYEKYKEIRDG